MHNEIIIKGAREHNLKNISLTIPRNKLVCFTGLSGSGKSSFILRDEIKVLSVELAAKKLVKADKVKRRKK